MNPITRFLALLYDYPLHCGFCVLLTHSDEVTELDTGPIEILVVSSTYDESKDPSDVECLGDLAREVDGRIQPIPCGELEWRSKLPNARVQAARQFGIILWPEPESRDLRVLDTESLAAVETLYEVFRRYPRGEVVGCNHCVFEEHQLRLKGKPLRELSSNDLSVFVNKAITLWGEAEDFKHFLPRILELLILEECGDIDSQFVGFKLIAAKSDEWPEDERKALGRYLIALTRYNEDDARDLRNPCS